MIVTHLDVSQSDEKQGFKYTIVHAGARKGDFNPHAPLSEEARQVLEAEVNRAYGMLVTATARNRALPESDVRRTEAALYFGNDAIAARLADRLGTRQDALNELRDMAAGSMTSTQSRRKPRMSEEAIAVEAKPAVDIESIQAAARKEGYAEAREIVELCALAAILFT